MDDGENFIFRKLRWHASRGFGLRYWILVTVSKKPSSGSDIIDQISNMSFGFWNPSPGSIYPTLRELSSDGYIKMNEKNGRKLYSITKRGEEYLNQSWFPWKNAARFINTDSGANIRETIEDLENYSEFLLEKKDQIKDKESLETIKKVIDKLNSVYKK